MKYGFVRCETLTGSVAFMRPSAYDKVYCHDQFFQECKKDLVIFDRIYVAAFDLLVSEESILKYNDEASLIESYEIMDPYMNTCMFFDERGIDHE